MGMLDGKVAIVTGAGHGIGRGHAMELAKHGAKVVINDVGGSVSGEGAGRDADLTVDIIKSRGGEAVSNYADVSDYVLSQEGATEFLDRYVELIDLISGGYKREGKRYLTLAVGCTGGKHRSVAVAEELRRRLEGDALAVQVVHRDLGTE